MKLCLQLLYFAISSLVTCCLSSELRKSRQNPWFYDYGDDQTEPFQAVRPTLRQGIPTSSTTTPSTTTSTKKDCTPYNPEVPDFSAPGRRISQVKCDEFIWQRMYREEKQKWLDRCYTPYVFGGRKTLLGEFPHMGGIGWQAAVGKWIFKCGGSLISPNFVLTAAHCTRSRLDSTIVDPVPKIVRFGDKNIIDKFSDVDPVDANISRIIVHPSYNSPKKYFDIALLKLEKDVTFTKLIQPACLWGQSDTGTLGNQATVTGWGIVESGSLEISPELQAADVEVIDSNVCDGLLRRFCNRNWCGLADSQICGGKLSGGIDACQGDSGGPLQVKIELPPSDQGSMHYVIGIISFGIGCGRPDVPGVYTRVSSFIDWIESEVWP